MVSKRFRGKRNANGSCPSGKANATGRDVGVHKKERTGGAPVTCNRGARSNGWEPKGQLFDKAALPAQKKIVDQGGCSLPTSDCTGAEKSLKIPGHSREPTF